MRVFTFLLLEVLLAPLTVTSFVLLQLWIITIGKQQQISLTALAPLLCRWLLHIQGIRPDETTHRLVDNLSALNSALCWGSVGPTLFAANLTGYTPSFFKVPPIGQETLSNMIHTRTLFFDRAIAQSLPTAEQIVILGAGFDTRLFKFCSSQFCLSQGSALPLPALFEVDQPPTQQAKIRALRKSNIDFSEVSFVSVNFNQENWADKLLKAGFEKGKPSFFLWEGVTYYLTEPVVKETLRTVAEMSGAGSAVAFDVFSSDFVSATDEWQWIRPAITLLDFIGEPFRFGIDIQDDVSISQLLAGAGFQLNMIQTMRTPTSGSFSGLIKAVI